jgi:hypothetical protein
MSDTARLLLGAILLLGVGATNAAAQDADARRRIKAVGTFVSNPDVAPPCSW